MKPILKHTDTPKPDMEYHLPGGAGFSKKTVTIIEHGQVIPPPAMTMDLKDETKPLIEKPVDKCTWSFFKMACCEALRESCDETFNRPTDEQFINQHINFLPHLP